MGLKDDLQSWTNELFKSAWSTKDGTKVPDDDSKIGLKNEAVKIEGTVLYADLADSTKMVDQQPPEFAAEVYKSFLYCAGKVIRDNGGVITAYDGDRIMAVFIGDSKNSNAAKTALKIRAAIHDIVEPELRAYYKSRPGYSIPHVTGIDTSHLFVAKTGVRGANDLVWVGRAANYAAKLSSLPSTYTYITKAVYERLSADSKLANGVDMWTPIRWDTFDNSVIYRSSYRWPLS